MDIITPEKMEPLMFKLLLSDPKYSTLLAPLYQKEWLNDSDFGKLCAAIIKLYEKNSALPKFQTIDLVASKLFPDTYSEVSIKIKAANSINITEYDREYLDEELLKYIRNQGIYWTIMSNVEEIEQTHSVEGMIGNLKEHELYPEGQLQSVIDLKQLFFPFIPVQ